jgi:HEAT repeat protein
MSRKPLMLGSIGLAAVLVWAAWFFLKHREPVYQGKTLNAWMEQCNKYLLASKNSPELAKREEAQAAIRQIGTNALPALLGMVRARDSALKAKLIALGRQQTLFKLPFKPAGYYHGKATWGFGALGAAAKPAVPALIELLQDKDKEVRASAATCLSLIGPDAKDAVPALIQALNREGNGWGPVLIDSMMALGAIGAEPQTVVPLLLEYVDGPRKEWNYCIPAMDALGRYRGKATSAVPAILPYLNDPDATRRWYADAALCAIDPDGTVRARSKALEQSTGARAETHE